MDDGVTCSRMLVRFWFAPSLFVLVKTINHPRRKGKKNGRRQEETDVRNPFEKKAQPMKTITPSEADMARVKERMLMRIYGWDVSTARKYLKERELEEARTRARNEELAKTLWYRLAGVTPKPV